MSWLEDLVQAGQNQLTEEVREALWTRGVDDGQIDLYQIGYLPEGPVVEEGSPLFTWANRHRERLRNSLVLPLTNSLGQVKGVQFRSADRAVKGYLDYFAEEFEPVLFGLGQAMPKAWETSSMHLVEGAFDLFPIQRQCPNVVSCMTAKLNAATARLLRRFVKTLYPSFDLDAAGRRGLLALQTEYGELFTIKPPPYPKVVKVDGQVVKDPGDLWEAWGDERIREFLRCNVEQEI